MVPARGCRALPASCRRQREFELVRGQPGRAVLTGRATPIPAIPCSPSISRWRSARLAAGRGVRFVASGADITRPGGDAGTEQIDYLGNRADDDMDDRSCDCSVDGLDH